MSPTDPIQQLCRSRGTPKRLVTYHQSHPHRHVSPSTLTRHGICTPAPPPHATHSHATPLPPPLVSCLSPPLPLSTCHHRRHLCAATTAVYAPPLPPSTRHHRCTLRATGCCPLRATAATIVYVPPPPHSRCPAYHPLPPCASHPCPHFSGPTTVYLCALPQPAPSPPPRVPSSMAPSA